MKEKKRELKGRERVLRTWGQRPKLSGGQRQQFASVTRWTALRRFDLLWPCCHTGLLLERALTLMDSNLRTYICVCVCVYHTFSFHVKAKRETQQSDPERVKVNLTRQDINKKHIYDLWHIHIQSTHVYTWKHTHTKYESISPICLFAEIDRE